MLRIHPSAQNTRELETKEEFPDAATGRGGGEIVKKSPAHCSNVTNYPKIKFIRTRIKAQSEVLVNANRNQKMNYLYYMSKRLS